MFLVEVKVKACFGKGKNWPIIAKISAPLGRCNLLMCSCSAKYPVLGKQWENRQSYHGR